MTTSNPELPSRRVARQRSRGWYVALACSALALLLGAVAPVRAADAPTVQVIVQAGDSQRAALLSQLNGGRVGRHLDLVNGVSVEVTQAQLDRLRRVPGLVVSPDTPVTFHQTDTAVRDATAVFPAATGADSLTAAGIDGKGVTVAVLDTGIKELPDFGKRLVGGVDLSGEGNPWKDSYGHGTFVAGLIAGNGASSSGLFKGEAPGANLVSIKVSGADGAVKTSTVLSGIEWAVKRRADFGIRVLNLSFGADATQSTTTSPLNQAVQKAWDAGITVVASAGNHGPGNGSITKPGDDPLIITVGASDDLGTAPTTDDAMTSFSSVGPTWADGWFKPDLVAPGRSVVSLRSEKSTLDVAYPAARIGTANFKGSGSSSSAAIASGAAALMLQAHPQATPNEVKGRMMLKARPGPVGNPMVDGHGSLDVATAVGATGIVFNQDNVTRYGMVSPAVDGTVDLGTTWNGSSWNGSSWNGSSWNGSSWNGSSWNGSSWNGSSWNGSSWNGSSWNGSSWNGSSWNGSSWNGSSWNGSSWNGSSWNGSSWNGSSWNGSSWNGWGL